MATAMPAAIMRVFDRGGAALVGAEAAELLPAVSQSACSLVMRTFHFRASRTSQQRHQMRDQRLVRRRHLVVPQPVRPHPGEPLGLPAPSPSPPSAGRRRAASGDGSPGRRGSRRSAAPGTASLTTMPSSSFSSRISVSSGRSPASTLPPGNSQRPAIDLPAGRSASSTRPSASIRAQAATSTSLTLTARPSNVGNRGLTGFNAIE